MHNPGIVCGMHCQQIFTAVQLYRCFKECLLNPYVQSTFIWMLNWQLYAAGPRHGKHDSSGDVFPVTWMCDADLNHSNNLGWKRHSVMTTSGLLIAHMAENSKHVHWTLTIGPFHGRFSGAVTEELSLRSHCKTDRGKQLCLSLLMMIYWILSPLQTSKVMPGLGSHCFRWQLETWHVTGFKVGLC